MRPNESVNSRQLPTITLDTHFAKVSELEEVRFDPVKCADLLTHPIIGIAEPDISRIHIYLRPDYELAYTRKEQKAARKAHPEDYMDAASCEILEDDSFFGKRGDVLMTIVYSAGFDPNVLICHEGVHVQKMLDRRLPTRLGHSILDNHFPKIAAHLDAIEEAEADRAMQDVVLKNLRKGVIKIISKKKK